MDDKRRYGRIRRTRQGGFSLFEVLLTLAIAGILITLGMPHMGAFMMDTKVSTFANDLVLDFNFARNEAIRRNVDVTICRTTLKNPKQCANSPGDWTQGWMVYAERAAKRGDGRRADGSEALIRLYRPLVQDTSIQIRATDRDTNDIYIYQPNGVARTTRDGSPSNQLYLCSPAYDDIARYLTIAASGRVRAHLPSGTVPSCS